MEIKIDDLSGPEIVTFLEEHMDDMKSVTPPGSIHALDLERLKKPNITFWSVWELNKLIGCGAIKELDSSHGEIKSMRTSTTVRGKGIASKLLKHMILVARKRGYRRLSIETGTVDFFKPARKLYSKFGFLPCEPFADYKEDPNSIFMSRVL